jgi:hypothetical protein
LQADKISTERALPRARRELIGLIAALAIVATVALILWPITPRIAFNRGLGFDGVVYADIVRAMRGESDGALLAERAHYAYRPLGPALVAWSGLDVTSGFLLLNVASFIATGPLIFLLLRRYGASPPASLLGVAWWATLPAGLRYAIYDPVLTDGVGVFFMLAALVAILYRKAAVFAVALALGILVRENVVILAPFAVLALRSLGWRRAAVTVAVAALPALFAFVVVRVAPPVPPPHSFDFFGLLVHNWAALVANVGARAWRFAAAGVATLGLVLFVPLFLPGRSGPFLRSHPEWRYYVLATLFVIIAGGEDWDRYFLYLVPALLVLCFAICLPRISFRRGLLLTLAQLIAVRFAWPVGTTAPDYLAYNVATMDLSRLTFIALLSSTCVLAALVVVRWPLVLRKRPASASPPSIGPAAPTGSSAS